MGAYEWEDGRIDGDPDNETHVWTKRIEATGIKKALKKLTSQHKKMELGEKFDTLNPNAIRCWVSPYSNYYQDIRGLHDRVIGDGGRLVVGMVFVEIREVRIEPTEDDPKGKDWEYGKEIHNYGYGDDADWI